ncbi:alpha/beta hydrolase fold domain-containing protein [Mycolicibacterium sp.]|uniref:alpha/beta hydrolase fold domain-containing protein n=1 Tax=Mycolicibacterium sp. TaxID=2320850 RepID=UPI0037C9A33F
MAAGVFVGRLGGLAAALGVGAGIALAAQGVAWADTGSAPAGPSSSASSAKTTASASSARHKPRTTASSQAVSVVSNPARAAATVPAPKAPSVVAVALSVLGATRREDQDAASSVAAVKPSATTSLVPQASSARVAAKAEAVPSAATSPVDESLYSGPPPTIVQRAVVAGLRLINFVTKTFNLPFSLSGTSAQIPFFTDGKPDFFLLAGIKAEKTQYEGMAVWTLTPRNPSGQYVVGIHGGSFIGQISIFHWWTYTDMARDTGATIVVPLYTLAPVGTAASDIPVMADFISAQIAAHGSDNVSVIGDSAGGNIALAALQEIVKRNGVQPHRLVLLAPALDLSDTFPNPVDDPLLGNPHDGHDNNLMSWVGDLDPTDPVVSPIFGSLGGLPPTTVYSSSHDLLTQQALRLRDKATAAGADFTFVLRKGQFHDWTIFAPLPDAFRERAGIYQALGL